MSKKERRLPKPPTTPFGGKRRFGEEESPGPLMADEMARAMAEGKLEEFLKREMPDNEHARKLTMMMLGMTGMMPSEVDPSVSKKISPAPTAGKSSKEPSAPPLPEGLPQGLIEAVQTGDVQGLMGMLKKEHEKRTSVSSEGLSEERQTDDTTPVFSPTEEDTIEELTDIASQNNLTLDWIVLRALRRYIEEYRKTGLL